MQIKDLEISKELSHEERAVRGGAGNFAFIGGQSASNGGSGISFGSPETAVNVGPIVTQNYSPVNVDLNLITLTKTLSAVGSEAFQA